MLDLPGYKIFRKIYESDRSLVYCGVRSADGQRAIVKILKQDYPTPAALSRYQQEYEIIRSLNLKGVAKAYSLENYQRTLAIVLEDFGGESLKMLMQKRQFTLSESLGIAIQIADILGEIHAANIIHKDINPANILFNRSNNQLKIIDFGIASRFTPEKFTLEQPTVQNPNVLEGTLAYISPEQTGRMNRSLDYRTDFYSLGATLYEMLTGKLPFESASGIELVHCHIAKQPIPPSKVNPEIPIAVSRIILKLLAKNAEERYQSAWGIKADLEECLTQLQRFETISEFSLASQDISERFQIPQKLYGREREVETLLAAFERVAGNSTQIFEGQREGEIMLIAGDSGTGKSSLVQEIYRQIIEKRGYFIAGKFDRVQRNVPESAVARAFQELIQQLLTESEEQFQKWRVKLLAALDTNAQVIIDVIPELELIIGKQPAVPELGKHESQNRFNFVFQKFVSVFCADEHPLVIFLDDLQWADSPTLKLIQLMAIDQVTNPADGFFDDDSDISSPKALLIIGAYRDKDVSPDRPLMVAVEELQKEGVAINQITLFPLEIEHITNLIADTLRSDRNSVKPLAELVKAKTGGNPFFVKEFLKTLHAENLITFSFPSCPQSTFDANSCSISAAGYTENLAEHQAGWQWDIAQIEEMEITNNVVELMIGKLKKLPESTQQILRLAACVGTDFDLHSLSIISEKSPQLVFTDLKVALDLGLILPACELNVELSSVNFKFLHDRVQQAAYGLIEEKDKKIFHWQIGRLLWDNCEPDLLVDRIFTIVDRINIGIEDSLILTSIIVEQEERDKIANLNLIAGKKAKTMVAYAAAIGYLNIGRELLTDSSWESQYELTLNLYVESVEVAYFSGDLELMEKLAGIVLIQGKTLLDKVKVYEVKIQAYIVQRRQLEAIAIALEVLAQFGVNFAKDPSPLDIQREMEQTVANLAGKNIEDLINLPLMTSPEQLAAMRIGASIVPAALHCAPQLFAPLVLSQINSSIRYGNSPVSAFFYATWGVLASGMFQGIETANKLGNLALELREKLNIKSLNCRALYVVGAYIFHTKNHVRDSLSMLRECYHIAVKKGDLEIVGYCAKEQSQYSYFVGQELTTLKHKIADYSNVLAQLKQSTNLQCNQIFHQAVINLLGQAENPCKLSGKACEEEQLLPLLTAENDRTGLYCFYLHKLILCYLFGDVPAALKNAREFRKYLTGVTVFLTVPLFHFYDSLIALAAYPDAEISERNILLKRVEENQTKMQK